MNKSGLRIASLRQVAWMLQAPVQDRLSQPIAMQRMT
jgi:hypothetical protein